MLSQSQDCEFLSEWADTEMCLEKPAVEKGIAKSSADIFYVVLGALVN